MYRKALRPCKRLTRWITSLSHIMSRSLERCHCFFLLLRKNKNFKWIPECQEALGELKPYPSSPFLLSKSNKCELLLLYFTMVEVAVSAIFFHKEDRMQYPINDVSRRLISDKSRYSHLEKLALALVEVGHKLWPYF